METKFNFNSQVCTDRFQSERLLALGLKKETADMCHRTNGMGIYFITAINPLCNPNDIPAWSLHRLWELLPKDVEVDDEHYATSHLEGENAIVYHDYGSQYYNFDKKNIYDNIIDCIEWLIKEGYFNKEYLV